MSVMNEVAIAARMTAATLVLTGLAYPFAVTAVAKVLFPAQAAGTLVEDGGGAVVGSRLIAQPFAKSEYFQPRPSAAGANGYDAAASSGSNLGPTSQKLRERIATDAARLRRENPHVAGSVPADLATASGSGLDPHITPQAARWQAPRVADARGVPVESVIALVESHVEPRTAGFLGEPRVNVLALNIDLDREFRKR